MTNTLKTIIGLGIASVFAIIGYFMLIQRDSVSLSFDGYEAVSNDLLLETQVFIERRAALEARTLDIALLTNPKFTSLRSYTTTVPNQSVGKINLFAPATPVPPPSPTVTE
jgi:hypothetical protein